MDVAKRMDASPSSLMAAMTLKTVGRFFPRKEGQHLSVKIAADYRDDVGCPESYLDFVRFIHVKYDWNTEDLSVEQLNERAREAIRLQRQPEISYEVFRTASAAHEGIDAQPNLKAKRKHAAKHSTFRTDVRDTCSVSYVGQQDWGGLADHISACPSVRNCQ